jgi:hypothetical protein
MNPVRTRLAAALLGAGLVIATPVAAWAGPRPVSSTPTAGSSSPTDAADGKLEELRTRCLAAIDVRLPALAGAKTALAGNGHVTDDHEVTLVADLDETSARLRVLAEEIKGDTDLASLRDHCRSIFEDNRVFALVLPRVRLVAGADTAGDAGAKLRDIASRLADLIARAEGNGADVAQAKLDLSQMKASIASGVASAGTVPGAVLGLTPADWNANHDVLKPAHQSLRSARADLRVARNLAEKIRNELKPRPSSPQG